MWLGLDRLAPCEEGSPGRQGWEMNRGLALAQALARAVERRRELTCAVTCPLQKAEPGSRVLGRVAGLEAS